MNPKIKTVIVDDEPLARSRIRDLLAQDDDIDLVRECRDGFEAVEQLTQSPADLLFLDVQMPEKDGFTVVQELPQENLPLIVFVTAYDQYALKAFEVHALDYLLKPYDDERFFQALEHAKQQIREKRRGAYNRKLAELMQAHQEQFDAPTPAIQPLERLVVKERGESLVLQTKDVVYIEGEGVYVRLHLAKRSYLLRERMGVLEQRLDDNRFFRIHRSSIVNLEYIQKLVPHFHGDYIVVLHNGVRLKLSRSRRAALQAKLGSAF